MADHTPTIAVVNQKGGVGKSLIADELTFWCDRYGVPYAFYDLDQQGGTAHATGGANAETAARVAIADTPGAITRQLNDVLDEADVVVVPVRPTERDVPATERTLGIAEQVCGDAAVGVVVVNGRTRFLASSEFERHVSEWEERGWEVARVPHAEAVARAGAAGVSVVAFTPRSKVAEAVDALCELVVTEALGEEVA